MPSLVVVFGATGKQGGSVVSSLLAANKNSSAGDIYSLRAVTRKPSGPKAQALAQLGVEVVKGDLDDYDSILRAFEGAELAFGTTDFWEPFAKQPEAAHALGIEVQQGKHLVDAAAATSTLKHYIWSSLPNLDHTVPHFESKVLVDEYLTNTYPALAQKTTYFYLGVYASNFLNYNQPVKAKDGNGFVWAQAGRTSSKVPFIGNEEQGTGIYVEAIFRNRALTVGKYVQGISDVLTFAEVTKLWGTVVGVQADAVEVTLEEFKNTFKFGPAFGEELGLNMLYFSSCSEKGLDSWTKPGYEQVTKEELGIRDGDLVSVEQAFRQLDWTSLLTQA